MFKKNMALSLALLLISIPIPPIYKASSAETTQETLNEFLKSTDSIIASYSYPPIELTNDTGKSTLKAHMPIVIRCKENITTKNITNGATIFFSVANNIKDKSGNILIKKDSLVTAQISFAKNKGMMGKSGEIIVSDFHTTAVDGSYIPLSCTLSAKPDDKMVTSVVLSVLICPLFLLMKGEEAQLNEGATKTAYTIVDSYIKTKTDL